MENLLSPIREGTASVPMDISATPKSASPVLTEIVDEYKNVPLALDMGFKGLTISFVIIGHGGVKNTIPLETFREPKHHPMGQINILGLRFAGLLNILNQRYDQETDAYLAHYKNTEYKSFIATLNTTYEIARQVHVKTDNEYIRRSLEEFTERVKILKKRYPKLKDNWFGTKNNYSKENAQKFYTGVTADEIKNNIRHTELTIQGPLVKVYSIIRNREELLPKDVTIKLPEMKNGITLTEIIDLAIDNVSKNEKIFTVTEKSLYFEQLPINIDVVDLTCNHTDQYPIIGFIE